MLIWSLFPAGNVLFRSKMLLFPAVKSSGLGSCFLAWDLFIFICLSASLLFWACGSKLTLARFLVLDSKLMVTQENLKSVCFQDQSQIKCDARWQNTDLCFVNPFVHVCLYKNSSWWWVSEEISTSGEEGESGKGKGYDHYKRHKAIN